MKVRLVTSLREYDALAPIWRDLTRTGGQPSPFLSHDWFACCWRTAGPHRRREIWIVGAAGAPVALVPLVRWKSRRWGIPLRVLSFLGSPEAPFIDIPMAGPAADVVPTVLEALQTRHDWDVLSLPKLPAHSTTLEALRTALPGQFLWREVGREQSPYVAISGSWKEFIRGKSPELSRTSRSGESLGKLGVVTVEEHREVDTRAPVFAEVMRLSRQSWNRPRGVAAATMQGMSRFFRELTPRATANGWLHLWILRLDGRAVSTEYQIADNGSLHTLRADFDSAMAEQSPEASLNFRIIQALFERRNVHRYDMGPGSSPDRLRWATGVHEAVALDVYARTPYGRLLHMVETRLMPLVRRWQARGSG